MFWCIIIWAILVIGFVLFARFGDDLPGMIGLVFGVLAAFATAISLIVIIVEHTDLSNRLKLAELQARREAIEYQMENNLYLGDALGDYNSEIRSMKMQRESLWTNWFIGPYADEVSEIPLE